MPRLACRHRHVLSGERRAKAEKRKISESPGRLFLGTFLGTYLAAQKSTSRKTRQWLKSGTSVTSAKYPQPRF
jgi:hypothetical protein